MNITEFRKQYPQYNDISDGELANTLHQKYYSDMDYGEFANSFLGAKPVFGGGDTGGQGVTGTTPQSTFNVMSLLAGGRPLYGVEKAIAPTDQQITQELPTIGMLGGGAIGSLGGPPGAVAGAGLGTGIGRAAQLGIEGMGQPTSPIVGQPGAENRQPTSDLDIVYDVGKNILYGAGAEMAGGLIGAGASAVLRPGLDLAKTQIAKGMLKEGYPITRNNLLQQVAEKIPPGNMFFQKWRKTLSTMINKANDQYATEVLQLPSLALKTETQEAKRVAFDKMTEAAGGKEALVATPNLKTFIDQNLDTLYFTGNKGMQKALSALKEDLTTTGTITFGKLNNISSNVWGKNFGKLAPQERQVLGELRSAVEADMKNIQETTGKPVWDAYTSAMEKSRQMHRFGDTSFIENMFKKATDYHADKQEYIFSPVKFRQIVDDSLPRLNSMFKDKPEIPQMINAYADKMMLAAGDLTKYASSKTTSQQMVGWAGGAGLAALPHFNPGLAVPWGFETAMAYSLANPRGWMKKMVFRESAGNIPKLLEIGSKPLLLKLQQGVNP